MGRLLALWWSLPARAVQTALYKAALLSAKVADGVKDGLLDLGYDPDEDEDLESFEPLPLQALDADRFVTVLRAPVEDALRRMAERLNEAPGGPPSPAVEQQVRALFDELVQEALAQAFELRMAASETDLPPPGSGSDWARKYRRMMAREGRWPVPPQS
jgi:hypothetical protein